MPRPLWKSIQIYKCSWGLQASIPCSSMTRSFTSVFDDRFYHPFIDHLLFLERILMWLESTGEQIRSKLRTAMYFWEISLGLKRSWTWGQSKTLLLLAGSKISHTSSFSMIMEPSKVSLVFAEIIKLDRLFLVLMTILFGCLRPNFRHLGLLGWL